VDWVRVAFVGVSCVGKTTIARLLAQGRGCPFFDLDEDVMEAFQASIERLQNRFLTDYSYRKECAGVLERIATAHPSCVIALPPSGLRDAFLRVKRRVPMVTVAVHVPSHRPQIRPIEAEPGADLEIPRHRPPHLAHFLRPRSSGFGQRPDETDGNATDPAEHPVLHHGATQPGCAAKILRVCLASRPMLQRHRRGLSNRQGPLQWSRLAPACPLSGCDDS
jgi:hypothetical protein